MRLLRNAVEKGPLRYLTAMLCRGSEKQNTLMIFREAWKYEVYLLRPQILNVLVRCRNEALAGSEELSRQTTTGNTHAQAKQ